MTLSATQRCEQIKRRPRGTFGTKAVRIPLPVGVGPASQLYWPVFLALRYSEDELLATACPNPKAASTPNAR